MKDAEFLKIQRQWYARLRNEGFIDIENEREKLRDKNRRTIGFEDREYIREFFTEIGYHLLNRPPNIPKLHTDILLHYIEGMYINDIAVEVKRGRRWVNHILALYIKR